MTRYAILMAAALVAGAAVAQPAPAPLTGGTIALEPKTGDGDYDPATQIFVDAAAETLAMRGFTMLDDPGHAAFVGELILTREDVGTAAAKAPTRGSGITPGAAIGTGVGVAIPFSTGKSSLVPLRRTRLELRIHRRGEDAILWHGAAVTVRTAGVPGGTDKAVAADLSRAMLQPYPAIAPAAVGVP